MSAFGRGYKDLVDSYYIMINISETPVDVIQCYKNKI